MTYFRKKPITIEALHWDGTAGSATLIIDWVLNGGTARFIDYDQHGNHIDEFFIEIDTLEGTMRVSPGDWVICGVMGEFYPCKPDIFDATYYEVIAPATTTPHLG